MAVILSGLALSATVRAQFSYTIDNDQVTLTRYTGAEGVVTVPEEIEGLPVTAITGAFRFKSVVTRVLIPSTVTSLGPDTFYQCYNLTSIELGHSLTNIGDRAFAACSNLSSIRVPDSVTELGSGVFRICTGLTHATIGDGITVAPAFLFDGCFGLLEVTFGRNITDIGGVHLGWSDHLRSVKFSGNAPVGAEESGVNIASGSTVYYLPGTSGWGATFGRRPTAMWCPQILTGDQGPRVQPGGLGFTISWANHRSIVVEACGSLLRPVWSPIGTATMSDGSAAFRDADWAKQPIRFYRVRSE